MPVVHFCIQRAFTFLNIFFIKIICWVAAYTSLPVCGISEWCSGPRWELLAHDDVIKWKHFPRDWPFVRGIHRSPVNSPHKGQWRGALMFSLICVWKNGWVNNREAGDWRRYHGHYDVTVILERQKYYDVDTTKDHPSFPKISTKRMKIQNAL